MRKLIMVLICLISVNIFAVDVELSGIYINLNDGSVAAFNADNGLFVNATTNVRSKFNFIGETDKIAMYSLYEIGMMLFFTQTISGDVILTVSWGEDVYLWERQKVELPEDESSDEY